MMDAYLFQDIQQAGDLSDHWKEDYNKNHPHESLGGKATHMSFVYGRNPNGILHELKIEVI